MDVDGDGGSPRLGETPAVEFGNTRYAVRGRVREGIGTPTHLRAWLAGQAGALNADASALDIGQTDVGTFLNLRAAVRELFEASVDGRVAEEADVGVVNEAAAAAPRWARLIRSDGGYVVVDVTAAAGADAVRAALARDAMSLLGGPLRAQLRACHGPGCVLFFVKDHSRREWCSAGCGNRARAARHYRRHRSPIA